MTQEEQADADWEWEHARRERERRQLVADLARERDEEIASGEAW